MSQQIPFEGEASDLRAGDCQPWTAARCHRLLRQLQSRLASLRKLASESRAAQRRPPKRPAPRMSIDGEPNRPQKRIRHTYRSKRQPSAGAGGKVEAPDPTTPPRVVRTLGAMKFAQSSPATGRIDFPSPLWRKIRDQPLATPRPCSNATSPAGHTNISAAVSSPLAVELQSLRSIVPESQYRTYEQIFHWLGSLLAVTNSGPQEPHRKSLLAMCLRKVPACVKDIEAWDRQTLAERGNQTKWHSPNVSQELYGQLEAFGPSAGGWRPLRLVARSNGVALLSDAIVDGTLEPAFAGLLIRLCVRWGCAEEAGNLASSIRGPLPGPHGMQSRLEETRKLRPLTAMVETMCSRKGTGHTLDSLIVLFGQGKLPTEWLLTRGFRGLWTSGLEAITAARPVPRVTEFMTAAIQSLVMRHGNEQRSKETNSEQTLLSITAGVAAAALALEAKGGNDRETERRARAWRRLLYILDRCIFQARGRRRRRGAGSNGLFILAVARQLAAARSGKNGQAGVTREIRQQWDDELKQLVSEHGSSAQTQYRETIVLASSIARCHSRASTMSGRDSVEELCARLDEVALPGLSGQGLRADVAFSLAQKTKSLRDLAFAESLAPRTRTGTGNAICSTGFSGWRWEEGISEWVLRGPALAQPPRGMGAAEAHEGAATDRKRVGDSSQDGDGGCDDGSDDGDDDGGGDGGSGGGGRATHHARRLQRSMMQSQSRRSMAGVSHTSASPLSKPQTFAGCGGRRDVGAGAGTADEGISAGAGRQGTGAGADAAASGGSVAFGSCSGREDREDFSLSGSAAVPGGNEEDEDELGARPDGSAEKSGVSWRGHGLGKKGKGLGEGKGGRLRGVRARAFKFRGPGSTRSATGGVRRGLAELSQAPAAGGDDWDELQLSIG